MDNKLALSLTVLYVAPDYTTSAHLSENHTPGQMVDFVTRK